MPIVISLDAGTTGVRAMAVNHHGQIAHAAYREFTQYFPQPGWVEHDAEEIWQAMVACIDEVAHQCHEPVAAIGITNQRETVLAWDRISGQPRSRAIVWQDRRTAQRCQTLGERGALATIRPLTGLVLDPYFSGTKMAWLLDEGGVRVDDDLALGTIDTWILWKLTGGEVFATEPSNASRTMMFDITTLQWSPTLGDLLGVPVSALAEVMPSSGRFGVTAATTALGAGIPISGIAGDQQAALFGQACFAPGMSKNTYGTGSFLLMNTGTTPPEPVDGLLATVAWQLGADHAPVYAYEGSIFVTGAAVQWLRDGLGIIQHASDIGPLAETVPDTGDAYLVPAFTGLGSPWWDPYARGTIVGLTRGTTRAHLARAVVESMAYQVRDVADAMVASSGVALQELRVDGGASVMGLLLQLQADQLQVPVARPTNEETTALGAAYLAGLAEGVWSDLDELASHWHADVVVTPRVSPETADIGHHRWLQAVEHARDWAAPRHGDS